MLPVSVCENVAEFAMPRPLADFGDEFARRRRYLEHVEKRIADRPVQPGDLAFRSRPEVFQQRADQFRIVQGHDTKSVTRLIVQAAFAEIEFIVANFLG